MPDAVLDLLAGYQAGATRCGWSWGCKSANDKDPATHQPGTAATPPMPMRCTRAHQRSIKVCAHLIVGLPVGVAMDSRNTLQRVVETGVEGSAASAPRGRGAVPFGKAWQAGRLEVLTLEQYVAAAVAMISTRRPRWSITVSRPRRRRPCWRRLVREPLDRHGRIAAELARSGPRGNAWGAPSLSGCMS